MEPDAGGEIGAWPVPHRIVLVPRPPYVLQYKYNISYSEKQTYRQLYTVQIQNPIYSFKGSVSCDDETNDIL